MNARTPYQTFLDGLNWQEEPKPETPIEAA
jgi:hypothetical protein